MSQAAILDGSVGHGRKGTLNPLAAERERQISKRRLAAQTYRDMGQDANVAVGKSPPVHKVTLAGKRR